MKRSIKDGIQEVGIRFFWILEVKFLGFTRDNL